MNPSNFNKARSLQSPTWKNRKGHWVLTNQNLHMSSPVNFRLFPRTQLSSPLAFVSSFLFYHMSLFSDSVEWRTLYIYNPTTIPARLPPMVSSSFHPFYFYLTWFYSTRLYYHDLPRRSHRCILCLQTRQQSISTILLPLDNRRRQVTSGSCQEIWTAQMVPHCPTYTWSNSCPVLHSMARGAKVSRRGRKGIMLCGGMRLTHCLQ